MILTKSGSLSQTRMMYFGPFPPGSVLRFLKLVAHADLPFDGANDNPVVRWIVKAFPRRPDSDSIAIGASEGVSLTGSSDSQVQSPPEVRCFLTGLNSGGVPPYAVPGYELTVVLNREIVFDSGIILGVGCIPSSLPNGGWCHATLDALPPSGKGWPL